LMRADKEGSGEEDEEEAGEEDEEEEALSDEEEDEEAGEEDEEGSGEEDEEDEEAAKAKEEAAKAEAAESEALWAKKRAEADMLAAHPDKQPFRVAPKTAIVGVTRADVGKTIELTPQTLECDVAGHAAEGRHGTLSKIDMEYNKMLVLLHPDYNTILWQRGAATVVNHDVANVGKEDIGKDVFVLAGEHNHPAGKLIAVDEKKATTGNLARGKVRRQRRGKDFDSWLPLSELTLRARLVETSSPVAGGAGSVAGSVEGGVAGKPESRLVETSRLEDSTAYVPSEAAPRGLASSLGQQESIPPTEDPHPSIG
jgi:hypothetical protein